MSDDMNPAADPTWPPTPSVAPPGYVPRVEPEPRLTASGRDASPVGCIIPGCDQVSMGDTNASTHIRVKHPEYVPPGPPRFWYAAMKADPGSIRIHDPNAQPPAWNKGGATKKAKKAAKKSVPIKAPVVKPKPRVGVEFEPLVSTVLSMVFPAGQIPLAAFDVVIAWRAATAALLTAADGG